MSEPRAGFVALVGRPNVGKSTLLNALVGQKLAIVTPKPQTTRDRIVGIKNVPGAQLVFVDTPGLHAPQGQPLNSRMREAAIAAIADADVVAFLTEAARDPRRPLPHDDRAALKALQAVERPVVLVLTKADLARNKAALLPQIDRIRQVRAFEAVVPVSALDGRGMDALIGEIAPRLPESPPLFPDDMVTDRPERFLAAELVREQITLRTREELPYAVAVVIDRFEEGTGKSGKPVARISATIHVDKPSQKAILVGKGGAMLKAIGTAARGEIEEMIDRRVHLELFVRVTAGWARSAAMVQKLSEEG